jgi:hypothetical protein
MGFLFCFFFFSPWQEFERRRCERFEGHPNLQGEGRGPNVFKVLGGFFSFSSTELTLFQRPIDSAFQLERLLH